MKSNSPGLINRPFRAAFIQFLLIVIFIETFSIEPLRLPTGPLQNPFSSSLLSLHHSKYITIPVV